MQVAKSEYKIKGRNWNYLLRLEKTEWGQREKKMHRQALETDAVEVSVKIIANHSKLKARHDPEKDCFTVRTLDQCWAGIKPCSCYGPPAWPTASSKHLATTQFCCWKSHKGHEPNMIRETHQGWLLTLVTPYLKTDADSSSAVCFADVSWNHSICFRTTFRASGGDVVGNTSPAKHLS